MSAGRIGRVIWFILGFGITVLVLRSLFMSEALLRHGSDGEGAWSVERARATFTRSAAVPLNWVADKLRIDDEDGEDGEDDDDDDDDDSAANGGSGRGSLRSRDRGADDFDGDDAAGDEADDDLDSADRGARRRGDADDEFDDEAEGDEVDDNGDEDDDESTKQTPGLLEVPSPFAPPLGGSPDVAILSLHVSDESPTRTAEAIADADAEAFLDNDAADNDNDNENENDNENDDDDLSANDVDDRDGDDNDDGEGDGDRLDEAAVGNDGDEDENDADGDLADNTPEGLAAVASESDDMRDSDSDGNDGDDGDGDDDKDTNDDDGADLDDGAIGDAPIEREDAVASSEVSVAVTAARSRPRTPIVVETPTRESTLADADSDGDDLDAPDDVDDENDSDDTGDAIDNDLDNDINAGDNDSDAIDGDEDDNREDDNGEDEHNTDEVSSLRPNTPRGGKSDLIDLPLSAAARLPRSEPDATSFLATVMTTTMTTTTTKTATNNAAMSPLASSPPAAPEAPRMREEASGATLLESPLPIMQADEARALVMKRTDVEMRGPFPRGRRDARTVAGDSDEYTPKPSSVLEWPALLNSERLRAFGSIEAQWRARDLRNISAELAAETTLSCAANDAADVRTRIAPWLASGDADLVEADIAARRKSTARGSVPALGEAELAAAAAAEALDRAHVRELAASLPVDTVVYRILGNDLPPRHSPTQTLDNLRFTLENEAPLYGAHRRWIINRVADPARERELIAILDEYGESYIRLPFELDAWAREFRKSDADATNYVVSINLARDVALLDGERHGYRWVLPLDGNAFFTAHGWRGVYHHLHAADTAHCPGAVIPMHRMRVPNDRLLPVAHSFARAARAVDLGIARHATAEKERREADIRLRIVNRRRAIAAAAAKKAAEAARSSSASASSSPTSLSSSSSSSPVPTAWEDKGALADELKKESDENAALVRALGAQINEKEEFYLQLTDEPQVAVQNCQRRPIPLFDPNLMYAANSKLSFVWRLEMRMPGACKRPAGHVVRLASGVLGGEQSANVRAHLRYDALEQLMRLVARRAISAGLVTEEAMTAWERRTRISARGGSTVRSFDRESDERRAKQSFPNADSKYPERTLSLAPGKAWVTFAPASEALEA